MRTLIAAIALTFLTSFVANAQFGHLSLSAKSVNNGGPADQRDTEEKGVRKDDFKNDYTETRYTRVNNQLHQTGVEISIRNFGGDSGEFQVQWFFIGAPVEKPTKEIIIDSGEKKLKIPQSRTVTFVVTSRPVQSSIIATTRMGEQNIPGTTLVDTDPNLLYIPESTKKHTGTKLKGWVVRLKENGAVSHSAGSTAYFKEMGINGKLDAMSLAPRR